CRGPGTAALRSVLRLPPAAGNALAATGWVSAAAPARVALLRKLRRPTAGASSAEFKGTDFDTRRCGMGALLSAAAAAGAASRHLVIVAAEPGAAAKASQAGLNASSESS